MSPDRFPEDEDVPAPTKKAGAKKFRKLELERKRLIKCGYCPPHRMENASRKPKHTSWKKMRKNKFKGK